MMAKLRALRSPGQTRERSGGQALVEFALVAPMLFVLLLGIFEAGRFIFFTETLNSATRDGARYAIVHGADLEADGGCSSGPVPGDRDLNEPSTSDCDFEGALVQDAVRKGALNVADLGDMFLHDPVWTSRGFETPVRGGPNTGHNAPGNYVTVFLDFTYKPLIESVLGVGILPDITIEAESTLVVNY